MGFRRWSYDMSRSSCIAAHESFRSRPVPETLALEVSTASPIVISNGSLQLPAVCCSSPSGSLLYCTSSRS